MTCPADWTPSVAPSDCRDFDFTLGFEAVYLALVPLSCFCVLAWARFLILSRKDVKVVLNYQSATLVGAKLAAGITALVCDALVLYEWPQHPSRSRLAIGTAVSAVLASVSSHSRNALQI